MDKANRSAVFALFLMVLVWGYSWIVMKQMTLFMGPIDFVALRYLGGAIVLFIYLMISNKGIAPPPLLPVLIAGLAQTTGFQGLAQFALMTGGAGKTSLFAYTMPFWVVFFAWWLLQETPTKRQWIGVGLAAIGLTLVISPWQLVTNPQSIALAIIAGVCWAFGTIVSKRTFSKYQHLNAINFTAWQMFLGALALVLLSSFIPSPEIQWRSWTFAWGVFYSIFFASSLAWVLWTYIVRQLPTSTAGLSSLLVPICSIVLAWLILNESPSPIEILGIAFIICGLFSIRPR